MPWHVRNIHLVINVPDGLGVSSAACTDVINHRFHLPSTTIIMLLLELNIRGMAPSNTTAFVHRTMMTSMLPMPAPARHDTVCCMPCSYVLWKVVARHLPTPQKRTAFCAAVGGALLQQLAPDSLTSLQQAAAAAGGWLGGYAATEKCSICLVPPQLAPDSLISLQQAAATAGGRLDGCAAVESVCRELLCCSSWHLTPCHLCNRQQLRQVRQLRVQLLNCVFGRMPPQLAPDSSISLQQAAAAAGGCAAIASLCRTPTLLNTCCSSWHMTP
jgi:hypothetical protein